MDKKNQKQQDRISLFSYIKDNISPDGFFAPTTLPDLKFTYPDPAFVPELGMMDFYFTFSPDYSKEQAETIYNAVQTFVIAPNDKNKEALYRTICLSHCMGYGDLLIDKLLTKEPPTSLIHLAYEWLHNAAHREVMKFAILLCGLFNIRLIEHLYNEKLREDILLLARCEEFTFYTIYALKLSSLCNEKNIWDIIKHTKGWGRVYALEEASYNSQYKRDWLLRYGISTTIYYPDISLLCIKKGRMLDALRQEHLSPTLYRGIIETLICFTLFLTIYDTDDRETYEELQSLQATELLKEILRHGAGHNKTIKEAIKILDISVFLHTLADKERWDVISINDCHSLISTAEKLIYYKDWTPDVMNNIIDPNDQVNLMTLAFARGININLNDILLDYLRKNPMQTELLGILLDTEDPKEFNRLLDFAHKHLKEYCEQEVSLLPIVLALEDHPGEGEAFLVAALTSIYDWSRSYALTVLENWGDEYLTPLLKTALFKASFLAQNTLLRLRIEALQTNQSIEQIKLF